MSRSRVRLGASVLGTTLLIGGLALGTGTASAADASGSIDSASAGSSESAVGSVVGFVPDLASGLLIELGLHSGSISPNDVFIGCSTVCPPDPWPTNTQRLLALLQGQGQDGPFPALPWAPAVVW